MVRDGYQLRIKELQNKLPFLAGENFSVAPTGTHFKVFLSKDYVVRFRDDQPELLAREANFLQSCHQPLIPSVIWVGLVAGQAAMVERRLAGSTINSVWQTLLVENKEIIIDDVVRFLQFLRQQTHKAVYSVVTGQNYSNFLAYLNETRVKNIEKINPVIKTYPALKALIVAADAGFWPMSDVSQEKITLVHGDLIIHNLLTDGQHLTGVLDWESAFWGDPDYDLCRLWYYQECARAYQEQGLDDTFEADYLDRLIAAVTTSGLIADQEIFRQKYQFIRTIFYLSAVAWAVSSADPDKNIQELLELWYKKNGATSR
ncbi:MAG: aminoglycoside phosphotransferase family protein [Patescibacteria group bacterium]|jgi:aminoglycoside phosphotransferase (APT) family kinase protein